MDFDNRAPGRQRETFLSTFLAVHAVSVFLFVFFLICGGLSVYIGAVVAGLAGLGFLNYLLWGRSLSQQVAGEREEEEVRSASEEDWSWDEPYPPRHRL